MPWFGCSGRADVFDYHPLVPRLSAMPQAGYRNGAQLTLPPLKSAEPRSNRWSRRVCVVLSGPAWIRTKDQGIMSPLL
jgi:hypothetical protein